ncbi:RICIN domain-containing protein [Dactylosporangium sp. NPDC000244]|uniref:ricin-type beta-trefoil lectin domain protein n=1 Tax=Dactylosporangium sp. NPDC000244 TaxID=3154365 RepID=UPI00331D3901
MTRLYVLTLAVLLTALGLTNVTPPELVAATQVSVPAPAMGWASWNSFAANINAAVIKRQADAMVSSGLAGAGYTYVNIDEGWWQGTRDAAGNITVDTNEWPGGMAAIADYIHAKGLKAGIYTDAGRDGCGYYYPTGRPAAPGSGSEGHYAQDMLQFARWGFDFVKVDWCGGSAEGLDPQAAYRSISAAVAQATAATGRRLLLSVCDWGVQGPWDWAPGLAPMWRTSTDIIYWGQTANQSMVLTNFDRGLHPAAQHTGFVNDPDMMIAGMPGLGAAQNRTHLNLWAISGAPLLLGADLSTLDATTVAALKNADVVAADQDPRGLQGVKVAEDSSGRQVFGKMLSGTGRRAVVLLNRTGSAATMTVRWADLGLTAATATVRNAWTGQSTGAATSYSTSVPANDSVFLTVTGTEAAASTYEAEAAGNTRTGSAASAACAGCSGGTKVGNVGNGATLRFNGIASANGGWAVATVAYVNGDTATRTATVQVNGRPSTVVAFPPTGSWTTAGSVSITVPLTPGTNTMTFANAGAWAPDLDAVEVRALAGPLPVTGAQSGRCADVDAASTTNGAKVQLWDCNNQVNQGWALTGAGQLKVYGGKCLDAFGNGTANGTTVDIWDCNNQTNQQWTLGTDGTVRGVQSGLCLDAYNNGTANGTKLVLWACNGQANQRWTVG